jgi:hypothetical protein
VLRGQRNEYNGWESSASDGGLSEDRTSDQEMEVDGMEEKAINDEHEEEVVMEDKDYAKLRNKVVKPKKRVEGSCVKNS